MGNLKIGIIGCGGMGRHHTKNIGLIDTAEVTAAADLNPEVLAAYKAEFGTVKGYPDYKTMLQNEEFNAVVICLPTFLHRDAVCAAAEKKLHILCEKPLARTMKQGEEMLAACRGNGVILQLGFVRRYDNCWNKARELVQKGRLGTPVVWRDVRASFGPGHTAWYFDKAKGGGPILDGMIHNFDFGNYMLGRPVTVTSGLTKFKASSAVDTGAIWVEYDTGHVMANFWSWGVPEKVNSFSGMDLIGPEGALVFPNTFDTNEFASRFNPAKESIFLLKKPGGAVEPVVYTQNDMSLDQMKDFIACVAKGGSPRVTGEDGLLALKVALAALKEEELT